MPIRKSVRTLTDEEKQEFVNAIVALKAEPSTTIPGLSTYDTYPVVHQRSMQNRTPWSGDSAVNQTMRNSAHRGPAFLPWHRQFLKLFEADLQRVSGNSNLGLPYWDWENDPVLPDFVGGDGTLEALQSIEPVLYGKFVKDGPFGQNAGWPVVDQSGARIPLGPTNSFPLQRSLATASVPVRDPSTGQPVPDPATGGFQTTIVTLPTPAEVQDAVANAIYDQAPWDESGGLNTFRNVLEGWWRGPRLHNVVHVWVGGTMGPGTSPNDPIFFMHHCNVDRIWADWQVLHSTVDYQPQTGGPSGHNVDDPMFPWDGTASPNVVTVRDVLSLGDVSYDPAPALLIS